MWITAILAFFQAIPAITGGITAFTQSYYNAKVQITTAKIGGDVNVARQMVTGIVAEGQTRIEFLKVVSQSPVLLGVVVGFAGPLIIYEWKVVVWDNIVAFAIYGAYGFTPPIKGMVAEWMGVILGGIFGTGGVMAVGHMFFNRRDK